MSNLVFIALVFALIFLVLLIFWMGYIEKELSTRLIVPEGKVISTCTANYRDENGGIKETIVYLTLANPEELDKKTDIEVWSNFKVTKDK